MQQTDQVTDSGISVELRLKFYITINYIITYRMHMYFCRHLAAETEKYYVGGEAFVRELQLIKEECYCFKIYETVQKLPVWICDGYPGGNTLTCGSRCLLRYVRGF